MFFFIFCVFLPGDSYKNLGDKSHSNNSISDEENDQEKLPTPIDWKPQENCYFCVDGKLLTVNDKGDLVAESGSVHTEPELANRVCRLHANINTLIHKQIHIHNDTKRTQNQNCVVNTILNDSNNSFVCFFFQTFSKRFSFQFVLFPLSFVPTDDNRVRL